MKVSELTGGLLDYWVAMAEGHDVTWNRPAGSASWVGRYVEREYWPFCPSTDWAQGGPIMERERIAAFCEDTTMPPRWHAGLSLTAGDGGICMDHWKTGDSILVAAMRAYVASKFGEEVLDEVGKAS